MVARSYGSGALRIRHLAVAETAPFAENVAALHVLRGRIELESGAVHELSADDTWIAGSYGGATGRAIVPAILAAIVIDPYQKAAL
jgi:hypothetical protein